MDAKNGQAKTSASDSDLEGGAHSQAAFGCSKEPSTTETQKKNGKF